ncbi:protein yippee-like At4g27740 [Punica granatum]|uniref:Protein yippee-like n=1 Tax=Punica granatum TaxID=22663 RepID=A0A218X4L0_PUNGR|nr:protein yippee-like At4g27740 [Punica granatum]OWM79659.1 hypothetical protein CDL15_Pgr023071 [Punica granatum]
MAEFLGNPFFSCRNCRNPLALREDLLNKNFLAKTGQAYLFTNVVNIALGRKEDRQLITGKFAIATIYCSNCGVELGWKYLAAYDVKQKYKEGRFIIERSKIVKEY